jgi:hypothetical protein
VVSSQKGLESTAIDGVLGLAPQDLVNDYSLIARLFNESVIAGNEVYLDIANSMIHIGEANPTSMNKSAGFVAYPQDSEGAQWAIKIRDLRYDS